MLYAWVLSIWLPAYSAYYTVWGIPSYGRCEWVASELLAARRIDPKTNRHSCTPYKR